MKKLLLALVLAELMFVAGGRQTARMHADPCNDGVVFVGDSLTIGANASAPANTYVYQIVDFLGGPWNAFLSFTPATDLEAVQQAAQGNYSCAIIELGVHAVLEGQMSPDQFRQYYGLILDSMNRGDTAVVAGTIPWLGWAAGTPEYERANLYSGIIAEEGAKRQVAVADLWSATKLQPALISTPQDYAFLDSSRGDNFHPNDAGHTIIAQMYEHALVGGRPEGG